MTDPAQLGGLPVPVDIQSSDRVVVIRNGVPYIVDMAAILAEVDDGFLLPANNLSDVDSAATARSNLGAEEAGAAAAAESAAVAVSAQRTSNLSDLADLVLAQNNLAAASSWDDVKWLGTGVNPPGAPVSAELTEVATDKWLWAFADSAVMAYPEHQNPHDYLEGSDMQPHLHWTPTITGTYGGTFTLVYNGWKSAADGTLSETQTTLTLAIASGTYTAGTLYTQNFSGVITGLDRKISSLATITLKLALPTKPSGGLICLAGFDGHYQKDAFGSVTATSKAE
jgi:hypothetical protein